MILGNLGGAETTQSHSVIARRRPATWAGAAFLAVLAAMAVNTLLTNPRFEWATVASYMFDPAVLAGLWRTVQLTALCMLVAVSLGLIIGAMRLSANPLLAGASWFYVWGFRGTPVLVQLIFWFNLAALYPTLSLGIPFGPDFVSGSSNALINPFTAAVLGLGLNEAAYMAEIVRAGISSVDNGQREAAASLGMTQGKAFRRIILPQAMRVIIPPTGNETISMLKYTSLVSVIALPELLYSTQIIASRTFEVIPLLIVASLWYLVATSILMVGQRQVERRFSSGVAARTTRGVMGGAKG